METHEFVVLLSVLEFLLLMVQGMGWFILKGAMKRIEVAETNIIEMKDSNITRFERIISNQHEDRVSLIKEQQLVKEQLVTEQHNVKDNLIESIANLKMFIIEHQK